MSDKIDRLTNAVENLTDQVSRLLNVFLTQAQVEERKVQKRKELIEMLPFNSQQLYALKRPELVMLAAQLGIRNTSVPQEQLIEEVLKAQSEK
jgi:DNA topoisomerase VI subunit B